MKLDKDVIKFDNVIIKTFNRVYYGSILVKRFDRMIPDSKIIFIDRKQQLAFRLKDVIFLIFPRSADSFNLYVLSKITTVS